MVALVINLWDLTYKNETSHYSKKDIEEILARFNESGATYCEIIDDEVEFYLEEEEADEEYNRRIKNEESAAILVEKYEFEKAKETYLKLKDKYGE